MAGGRLRPAWLGLIALGLVLGVGLGWYQSPLPRDDAYISYRYAANLASGQGFSFNAGGPSVEGFSCPAWVFVLAAVAKLVGARALESVSMLLGMLAFLLTAALCAKAAWGCVDGDDAKGRIYAAALAGLVFSLLPSASYYAATGMETLPWVLCLAAVTVSVVRAAPTWMVASLGVLAVWFRPEGPWVGVATVAYFVGARRIGAEQRRAVLVLAASSTLALIALLAWRQLVFESWLPNTYYAKPSSRGAGATYVKDLVSQAWVGMLVGAALCGALLGTVREADADSDDPMGYFAAGVAWVFAALLEGGDWMPMGRMLLPALPFLAIALAGWVTGRARVGRMVRRPAVLGGAACLICVLWLRDLSVQISAQRDASLKARAQVREPARALANWFAEAEVESAAAIDIGELGYRWPGEIVDLAGLTDSHLGRLPGAHLQKPLDHEYILRERAPQLIVLRLSRVDSQMRGAQRSFVPRRDAQGRVWPFPEDAMSMPELELLRALQAEGSGYHATFIQLSEGSVEPMYARVVYAREDSLDSFVWPGRDGLWVLGRVDD